MSYESDSELLPSSSVLRRSYKARCPLCGCPTSCYDNKKRVMICFDCSDKSVNIVKHFLRGIIIRKRYLNFIKKREICRWFFRHNTSLKEIRNEICKYARE